MGFKNILLSLKNKLIPISVLSSSFIATAASAMEDQSFFIKPDKPLYLLWKHILGWFPKIPEQQQSNTIMVMLADIFDFISNVVVWTPEFFFSNQWVQEMVSKFGLVSVGLITTLTIIEGFKKMLGLNHTPFHKVLIRLPISLLVSAFAPYLFTKGATYLNKLTKIVIHMGYGEMLQAAKIDSLAKIAFSSLDGIALTLFVAGFLITAFPILLRHGKRWFNLIVCLILTPFAMSAYLFDDLKKYHKMWLNTIQNHAASQLAYSIYICILALMMLFPIDAFGDSFIDPVKAVYTKLLVLLGGLWQMAFPPKFVQMGDKGDEGNSMIKKMIKHYTKFKFLKK